MGVAAIGTRQLAIRLNASGMEAFRSQMEPIEAFMSTIVQTSPGTVQTHSGAALASQYQRWEGYLRGRGIVAASRHRTDAMRGGF